MKVYIVQSRYASEEGSWDTIIRIFDNKESAKVFCEVFNTNVREIKESLSKNNKVTLYQEILNESEETLKAILSLEELPWNFLHSEFHVEDHDVFSS